METPILIADLGGTTLRFALAGRGRPGAEMALAADLFSTLEQAVAAFLDPIDRREWPYRAIFAAAGPQDGRDITFTNRDWRSPIAGLRDRFGLNRIVVINDFAALALALPHLTDEDTRSLGPRRTPEPGPMVVLGPGTGLGVASVLPEGDGWRVIPGEGGHVTLPAQTEIEDQVISYLRAVHGHVSAERALSGAGLADLHDAVRAIGGLPARRRAPEEVSEAATADPACRRAVELFTDLLATVAGDLALTMGANGGVFIAGGIVPKLGDLFDGDRFRRRFTAKGRLTEYLDPIPTRLITHPQPALLGLAAAAEAILDTSV